MTSSIIRRFSGNLPLSNFLAETQKGKTEETQEVTYTLNKNGYKSKRLSVLICFLLLFKRSSTLTQRKFYTQVYFCDMMSDVA